MSVDCRRLGTEIARRLCLWGGILAATGLLAASLVRMAPGFGMDDRLLDTRLNADSRQAIAVERAAERDVFRYYATYMNRLAHGDLGRSVSLGRPVKELLIERAGVTVRSGGWGLLLAWVVSLGMVFALEWRPGRLAEAGAGALTGGLLCLPSALAALLSVYAGAPPAVAVAAILLPRIFRYARNVVSAARRAPHVLSGHAFGIPRVRLIARWIAMPVLPDLAALAGVSVSMAVGATVPVEALCDSPGVGHLVWQAALSRDVPVLVNVTLLIAALTAGANLLADAARAAQERTT